MIFFILFWLRRRILFGIFLFFLASCQLLPKAALIIHPLPMPNRSALIQGTIVKDGKKQALTAMVESDDHGFNVVVLNSYGQRSRTLISDKASWSSRQVMPDTSLIDDAALLTSMLCVFAGPAYSQLSAGGHWIGRDLIEARTGAAARHTVVYSEDPWNSSSAYRKQINEQVVFELQLQAAPF